MIANLRIFWLAHLESFVWEAFPIIKCLFGKLSSRKWTIVFFFELFQLFPILWQASMSYDFTSIPTLVNTEIIFSSKQLSSSECGIPHASILFLLPYCSSLFWLISREVTLLSNYRLFLLNIPSWLAIFNYHIFYI